MMAKHHQPKLQKKKIEPLFQGLDFSLVETIIQLSWFANKYFFLVHGYRCQLIKVNEKDSLLTKLLEDLTINNTLDLLSYQYTNPYGIRLTDLHQTYMEFLVNNL